MGPILTIIFLAQTIALHQRAFWVSHINEMTSPKPKTPNAAIRDFLEYLFKVCYYGVECLYRGATSSPRQPYGLKNRLIQPHLASDSPCLNG